MRRQLNPLTWLILLILYLVILFQSGLISHCIGLTIFLFILSIIMKVSLKKMVWRSRHILLFIPILFLFYITISIFFFNITFHDIFLTVSISAFRIILMVFCMTLFLEINDAMMILDALRTLWRKTGISSRKIEDFFLLLYLTFRFYPLLREEVRTISSLGKALGLPSDQGKIKQVKRTASYLPGMIMNCLHRADNLALAMEIRGYGRFLPRGLVNPIGFFWRDAVVLVLALLMVSGLIILA